MKSPIFTFLALFLLPVFSFSQPPDWIWAKRAGGNSNEFSTSVATDAQGNLLICGYFISPSFTIGSTLLSTNGFYDVFIAKYDPNGNPIWAVSAGGTGDDNANAICTDAAGNVYVTGSFASSSIQFGSTTLTNGTPSASDIFLTKLNSSGTVQWAKSFGGSDWDVGQSVCVDETTGSVFLAGYLSSTAIDFGTGPLSTNGLADAFLSKHDVGTGSNQWAINAGGTVNDLTNGVDVDANGNVYISGGFASDSITFGTNTMMNAGPGFPDIFTAKYGPAGNHIWSVREGGPANDHAVAIDLDRFGNVIIAGHYHSTTFMVGSTTFNNGGMGDPFIIKYTNTGTVLWARDAGGNQNDFAYSVIIDTLGNSYLAGMFLSPSIIFGSDMLSNNSVLTEDPFLAKFDVSGNNVWAIGGGGMQSDYINDIVIYPATDKLFATGDFFSASYLMGSTLLTNTDNSGNTSDFFLAKLDMLTSEPEWESDANISVYPNPFTDELTISGLDGISEITLFNVLGELMFSNQVSATDYRLPTTNFPSGIYLLKLTYEGKTFIRRLSRL